MIDHCKSSSISRIAQTWQLAEPLNGCSGRQMGIAGHRCRLPPPPPPAAAGVLRCRPCANALANPKLHLVWRQEMAWRGRQAAWAALQHLLPPAQPAYSVFRGWQPTAFSLAQRIGWASSAAQPAGEAAGELGGGEQESLFAARAACGNRRGHAPCDPYHGWARRSLRLAAAAAAAAAATPPIHHLQICRTSRSHCSCPVPALPQHLCLHRSTQQWIPARALCGAATLWDTSAPTASATSPLSRT